MKNCMSGLALRGVCWCGNYMARGLSWHVAVPIKRCSTKKQP